MKIAAGVLAGALALSGCVVIDADDENFDTRYDTVRSAGTVFGADVTADTITFRVSSNGCTDKSFLEVDVDRRGSDRFDVTLDRVRVDYCKALVPDGVTVTYTFEELGLPPGADVTVRNPVRG